MYEDSWYNLVPDIAPRKAPPAHRRGESLLQQPSKQVEDPLPPVLAEEEEAEDGTDDDWAEAATPLRRTKSLSDLCRVAAKAAEVVVARRHGNRRRNQQLRKKGLRLWDVLLIPHSVAARIPVDDPPRLDGESASALLLQASQREWL
jgi:hypothetical protein